MTAHQLYSSPVSLSAREGDDGGGVGKGEKREREWAREKRMKELLLATRGLLLHFPGSCRFNNSVSRDDDDWNSYSSHYYKIICSQDGTIFVLCNIPNCYEIMSSSFIPLLSPEILLLYRTCTRYTLQYQQWALRLDVVSARKKN